MKIEKKIFFDLPMVLLLLALCGIMSFIYYADNKQRNTGTTAVQRNSVEVVKHEKNLPFADKGST